MEEATELCKHNETHIKILEALQALAREDQRPHEGLISKLVDRSGLPRSKIVVFLKLLRLRSLEFTDSPTNDAPKRTGFKLKGNDEPDDESEV